MEQQVAATLLDKGIEVPVTAPLLFRLFGKRVHHITIRPPFLGTLITISEVNTKHGLDADKLEEIRADNMNALVIKYAKPLSNIAALAWLNNAFANRLLAWLVAAYFRRHIDPRQLQILATVFKIQASKPAFTNTIGLVSDMTMTKPNLSQTIQGS